MEDLFSFYPIRRILLPYLDPMSFWECIKVCKKWNISLDNMQTWRRVFKNGIDRVPLRTNKAGWLSVIDNALTRHHLRIAMYFFIHAPHDQYSKAYLEIVKLIIINSATRDNLVSTKNLPLRQTTTEEFFKVLKVLMGIIPLGDLIRFRSINTN